MCLISLRCIVLVKTEGPSTTNSDTPSPGGEGLPAALAAPSSHPVPWWWRLFSFLTGSGSSGQQNLHGRGPKNPKGPRPQPARVPAVRVESYLL